MKYTPLSIPGAFLVELVRFDDDRGFLAQYYAPREMGQHGLNPRVERGLVAYNRAAGTLRGLHYQAEPHREAKLIRCTAGAVFDVMLDLRPESPTYRKWLGFELSAENRTMLYVPEGCAHGYLTLRDDSEVHYLVSEVYAPQSERGVRWDDPAFAIEWPGPVRVISEKDRAHPDYPV
jgi:dTDP-4-dehydrorhamnose 3,5-epimerase